MTDPQWLAALPQPVQEAVRLSLADLQQPAPVPLEIVTYQPDGADARFGLLVVRFADGTGMGFGVMADGDRADLVASVADQLQEAFSQEPDAWGEARARVPGTYAPSIRRRNRRNRVLGLPSPILRRSPGEWCSR